MNTDKQAVILRLSKDQHTKLKRLAVEDDRTATSWMRRTIDLAYAKAFPTEKSSGKARRK